MIDASHPGPGGEVAIRPIYWDYFVGRRPDRLAGRLVRALQIR